MGLPIAKNLTVKMGGSISASLNNNVFEIVVCFQMCIRDSDKGDGNPHVHLLLTMRPFNPDHSWGKKEVKDWDFVRDKNGNIVIDESHPNWWPVSYTHLNTGLHVENPVIFFSRINLQGNT